MIATLLASRLFGPVASVAAVLALALSVADHVHIIASGRFVFSGTPEELKSMPEVLDEHLGVSGAKSIVDIQLHA
jgi:ABC-type branched-subunit amino acid transport system ATPase component